MSKENDDENLMKAIQAVVKMSGQLKDNWTKTFGRRPSLTSIARELIPIQQLPPGATPTYERDIDVANIVTSDLGFKQWVGQPDSPFKTEKELKEEAITKEFEDWIAPELPPGDMPVVNDDDEYTPDGLYKDWGYYAKSGIQPPAMNGTVSVGKITIDVPGLEPILIDNSPPPVKTWIQTYTGRRFDPITPVEGAIVIDDIAHALSNMCRFTGHVKKFYSVAQHCVLVSYICDEKDALHGLLHDASEAYLVDIPRPLKRSGKFEAYLEMESHLQSMIYRRFDLSEEEPAGVKKADTILLATEARDLMAPLHRDWVQPAEPLPFKMMPLPPQEAKDLFMKRFYELTKASGAYDHYLRHEYGQKDI